MPSAPEAPPCLLCGRPTVLLYPSNVPNGAPVESSEIACTSPHLCVHDDIFTCRGCGLARAEPPDGVSEIEESYRDVHDSLYMASEPERREDFRRAIAGIERHPFVRPRTILEIGSSVGLFLDEATKRGWKATGIEPSRWASEQAAAMGLTVFNGVLDEFEAESESFDVVASWDVWEHLQDPLDSLVRAYDLLKPGGLLVLTTVNMGGLMARVMRGRWPWFMRMHLHYFTRKSLAEMVRRAGFDVLGMSAQSKTLRLGHVLTRASNMLGPLGGLAHKATGWIGLNDRRVRFNFGDILLIEARKPTADL